MTEISEAQQAFGKRQGEKTGDAPPSEWAPKSPEPLPNTYTQETNHRSFLDKLFGRNKQSTQASGLPEGKPPAMPAAIGPNGESLHGIPEPDREKTNTEVENLQGTAPAAAASETPDPLAERISAQYTEQVHQPDLSVDPNRPQPTVPGTRADYSGEWEPADKPDQNNQGNNNS